jgi:hypothetical protein
MRVRFQADADLNQIIVLATLRREPSVDFQTATAARLRGLSDPEVLSATAGEGRLLVTHDQRTMPGHFARFIAARSSPGVIVVPQHLPVAAVVQDLLVIWACTEAEEWTNRLGFLPL